MGYDIVNITIPTNKEYSPFDSDAYLEEDYRGYLTPLVNFFKRCCNEGEDVFDSFTINVSGLDYTLFVEQLSEMVDDAIEQTGVDIYRELNRLMYSHGLAVYMDISTCTNEYEDSDSDMGSYYVNERYFPETLAFVIADYTYFRINTSAGFDQDELSGRMFGKITFVKIPNYSE